MCPPQLARCSPSKTKTKLSAVMHIYFRSYILEINEHMIKIYFSILRLLKILIMKNLFLKKSTNLREKNQNDFKYLEPLLIFSLMGRKNM